MSSPFSRDVLGTLVAERLTRAADALRAAWHAPGRIASAHVDDVLPEEIATAIHAGFPDGSRMMFKSSMRERKHVAAQMDRYDPLLEEAVYAFQDPRVVAIIADITGSQGLEPDAELYAGGISAMSQGAYLRPHLDNSHDNRRQRYRAMNLLYYVTPGWEEDFGGSLQLWDDGPQGAPRTISSRFNRLVLMGTGRRSWHSVNEVRHPGTRCCVSNYYFSPNPPEGRGYFHATSFRAEHGKGGQDVVMCADNALRSTILKLTGNLLYRNPHVYRRQDAPVDGPKPPEV